MVNAYRELITTIKKISQEKEISYLYFKRESPNLPSKESKEKQAANLNSERNKGKTCFRIRITSWNSLY